MQIVGYKADLSYNIALCHYMMKQYAPALKHIADIIERGIREHPGIVVEKSWTSDVNDLREHPGIAVETPEPVAWIAPGKTQVLWRDSWVSGLKGIRGNPQVLLWRSSKVSGVNCTWEDPGTIVEKLLSWCCELHQGRPSYCCAETVECGRHSVCLLV